MGTKSTKKRKPPVAAEAVPATRHEQILVAALAVFSEKGFHGSTMLDIASRAQASKATLYAHFADKQALFTALVAWGTQHGTPALETIARDATLDARAALDRYATQLLTLMLQPEKLALFRIAVAEGDRLPGVGAAFSAATREHGQVLGRLIARRLVKEGLIAVDDPDDYGHAFMGLLQGELFNRVLLGTAPMPGEVEIRRHAERAMRRLVRAFAPKHRP